MSVAEIIWKSCSAFLEHPESSPEAKLSQTVLRIASEQLTGEDGLVNTQGGGLDGNKSDVSGDFVTNWETRQSMMIKNPRKIYRNLRSKCHCLPPRFLTSC